jgi:hypothetical protein
VLPEKKPLNIFLLFEPSLIHFIFQIFYTKRTSVDQRKTLVSGLHTLSKHTALILPHTFIALGLIQYIFNLFNRCWTNTTPTVSAAGKAGGTVIVIRSRQRIIISPAVLPFLICKIKSHTMYYFVFFM